MWAMILLTKSLKRRHFNDTFGSKVYPILVKIGIYKEDCYAEESSYSSNNKYMENTQPLNIAEIKLALDNNNRIRAEDIEELVNKTKNIINKIYTIMKILVNTIYIVMQKMLY